MAKLSQRAVDVFFSPKRPKVVRQNRKLQGPEYDPAPDFSDASASDEHDPAYFKLEPKSQLMDLPDSPPRYISSSSDDDDDDEDLPSSSRPARKLIRRSEASSSQAAASKASGSRPATKAAAVAGSKGNAPASRPQKGTQQQSASKGKGNSKASTGAEKDTSRPLRRAGKWTDDEDEDELDREAARAAEDDGSLVDGRDEVDRGGQALPAKSKGEAMADAPRPVQPRPRAQVKPETDDSDDADGRPDSPVIRRAGKRPFKIEDTDDSDAAPGPQTPPLRTAMSTVEDLLDAAAASQVRESVPVEDLLDAKLRNQAHKQVAPTVAPVKKEQQAVAATEAQVKEEQTRDESDSSCLIMETPPPEDKIRKVPPAKKPAPTPSRPRPGKSVVAKRKAATGPVRLPSLSRSPPPAPPAGASQRAQRASHRQTQLSKPWPRSTAASVRVQSSSRPSRAARPQQTLNEGTSSDEEESDAPRSSRRKGKGKQLVKSRRKQREDSFLAGTDSEEDEDEEDEPVRSTQRTSQKRRSLGQRKATPESTDGEQVEEMSDPSSSDGAARRRRTAKKRKEKEASKRRKRPLDSTDEEDQAYDSDRPIKSRRKKMRRKKAVDTEDEEGTDSAPDDLEDDAGRLHTVKHRMRTGTERAGTKELARRALLEKLKKRKEKKGSGVTSLLTDDEESEQDEPEVVDIWGRDARGRYATEDDLEFEKEFIEEDNLDIDDLDLPSAFRSDASQPMELNFNVVCQWHVHAIIKGRQWAKKAVRDNYFSAPLKRLRDHVISTRNSGVTSQVWPSEFKKSLDRYPEFEGFTIKGYNPPCDACRISSRAATRRIELSGKRFDPVTFERVTYDSDEESDEEIKNLKSEFNAGRNCFGRAQVYHQLTHWEDAIHEFLQYTIEEQLPDDEDDRPANSTIRVEGATYKVANLPNKADPDAVLEWLNKIRWISSQWSNLSDLLEMGRNLDAEFRRWET